MTGFRQESQGHDKDLRHHEDSDGGSPVLSPKVCQCGNQLAHWDWAGGPHPDLPECCWPAVEIGYATMVSHIPVNDSKISVQ